MFIQDLRDILISVYLVAGILLTLVLMVAAAVITFAVWGLIKSVRRPLNNLGEVSDAAVEHIAKPLRDGVSMGSVLGGSAGFMTGFANGFYGRLRNRGGKGGQKKG